MGSSKPGFKRRNKNTPRWKNPKESNKEPQAMDEMTSSGRTYYLASKVRLSA